MKKYIGIGFILCAISLFLILNTQEENSSLASSKYYKEEWGIDLLQPDEVTEIWGTKASFNGDGEWYNVFDYSSQEVSMKKSGMVEVTSANIEEVETKIKKFKETTISLYSGDEGERASKAFSEYPIPVEIGDAHYYHEKNEGNDYLIVLYKQDENKVYTMEWHQ